LRPPARARAAHVDLPRLQRGEGFLWAPGHRILERASFPAIRTFDSSRTPKRGERLATPRTLARVDLTAIEPGPRRDRRVDRGPGRPAERQTHSRRDVAQKPGLIGQRPLRRSQIGFVEDEVQRFLVRLV